MGMVGFIVCSLMVSSVKGSTHWVVTEEGKVQEQLDSPFAIIHPHDLVAFMRQEANHEKMQQIKTVLLVEKKAIEDNEDKNLDLEDNHYESDEDCKAAGKQLTEIDLFVSSVLPLENKEIQVSDYVDFSAPGPDVKLQDPDCVKYFDLLQTTDTFDNLEGVKNRKFLHLYQAEAGLKTTLKYMDSEEYFANAIDTSLMKNASSWVAYNLATFYWRTKGNAEKAMECVRRALHFSPTDYKDVALVSMANILHRAHYSLNASVVLEKALELSDVNVIPFTLGSIYATLGEFTLSAKHFENTLEEQPDFTAAKKRLHAVKCQHKLQLKLESQHESLQRTLRELEAYQEKHKKYVEVYQSIEKMQLNRQEQMNMHFLLMQHLIKEGSFDHKLCKFQSNGSGPVMLCSLPKPNIDPVDEDDELVPNINSGKKSQVKVEKDVRGHIPDAKATTFASGAEAGTFKEPEEVEKIDITSWSDPKWPTEEHCAKHAPRTLAWDEYPSTYINPEKRGFSVHNLLTSYIGVEEGQNLPWVELNCESLEPICEKTTLDDIQSVADRHSAPMHKQDEYVKRELLMHVNEGLVWPGDLAHRIQMAIKKSLKEKDKDQNLWLLYNYAGLYFRVQGDNLKAVECIRRAAHRTPKEHYDVTLLNMANIMYRLGKINDAMTLLLDALVTNWTEPVTYLAVGNVLQAKGNTSGAITFFEYGLFLNPQFREDFYALMNVKCAVVREKKLQEQMNIENTQASDDTIEKSTCDTDSTDQIGLLDNIKNAHNAEGHVYKTEQTAEGTKTYTVHAFASQETRVATECDNISDETDLVRRLETTKEDADKILHDADAVIKRFSHVAQDSSEELSMRVSSARQIMQQLSRMRENLGTLVDEASTTLDIVNPHRIKLHKEGFTASQCAHALHNVDLRSYLSSNMDVSIRGYNFGEELPPAGVKSPGTTQPHCYAPMSPPQYNVDDLETVINRASFISYNEEYGMELLLMQIIPSDSGNQDFAILVQKLAEGMAQHPTSWRLAFLSSYYWRLKGRAMEAIDCLRLSLSTAPLDMRDVVLLGLSNVFAQLGQWENAIHVTKQALLLYPDYFLYHFTLANILAAMGDIQSSIPYFKRALDLQPGLEIAQRRFEAAVCERQRSGVH